MRLFLALFIPLLQILHIYTALESNGKRDLIFSESISNGSRSTEYLMNKEPIEIDAFSNSQILVVVKRITPFKFLCETSNLKSKYPIVKASLCLKDHMKKPDQCIEVQKGGEAIFSTARFSILFDPLKGFQANLQVEASEYLNGYLSCELENANDRIISNNIEFQNMHYYGSLLVTSYKPSGPVREVKIKTGDILTCGKKKLNRDEQIPGWSRPLAENHFAWFFCPERTSRYCITPLFKVLRNNDQFRVFSNYSIQLYENAFDTLDYITIQCSSRRVGYSTYIISKDPSDPPRNDISVFSPTSNLIEMRELINSELKYELSAAYFSPAVTYIWLKDNGPVPNHFLNNNHSLTFPRTITPTMAGKYRLEVNQKYPYNSAHFDYDVKVYTLPKVVKGYEVPNVVYVMSGKSLNLTTRLYGNEIKTSVEINGNLVSTSDKKQQKIDFDKFRLKYPYLSEMSIKLSENDVGSSKELNYSIEKISGLWFKKGYSHRVTFIASNELGSTRISTLIKAIEKPRWKVELNQFPCVEKCFSNEPHFFKCAIWEDEYVDVGLQVGYQWRINGMELSTIFSEELRNIYFTIQDESLTINKISTDNNVRDLRIIEKFQNATLSCTVSIRIPTSLMNGEIKFQEIYNSINDPASMTLSKTNVSIIANNILQGGTNTLIWIICIPLIIITIVTTITVCTCYFIRSGKTYDIDQNERFAGKDPEQETFDSLYFKHYNREEENDAPILNDHISWSEHSCKNDIGEIDPYDTENENFDEGSIIGQYGNEYKR